MWGSMASAWRGRARGAAAAAMLATLAGCTTSQGTAPTAAALPGVRPNIAITTAELQGDWGLASFHNAEDRGRTEAEARVACGNPYRIATGATGGVMMHLADQTQTTEVFIKTGQGGQVFIGPPGPLTPAQDRVVLDYANGVLVSDWLDPGVKSRYGTMILVRCGTA
jgi:hypothetical protein